MPFSTARPLNGQQDVKIVDRQRIAKATVSYPKSQRAEDAVRWLRGELQVKPTKKLASETFGVNTPQLKAARERLEQRERGKRHGNGGATTLSDSAIEHIIAEVGPERVMRALDRLTQPELPLVAAE